MKHGKSADNAKTAADRNNMNTDEENDDVVLISMDDFAGVTFKKATNVANKRKENDREKQDEKKAQKKEKVEEAEVTKTDEVIPGVIADMVKPFNPDEWIQAMKKELHRLMSNHYEQYNEEIEDE